MGGAESTVNPVLVGFASLLAVSTVVGIGFAVYRWLLRNLHGCLCVPIERRNAAAS